MLCIDMALALFVFEVRMNLVSKCRVEINVFLKLDRNI